MTSDNERALRAIDNFKDEMDAQDWCDFYNNHIETIRTALQRDDSVVGEMVEKVINLLKDIDDKDNPSDQGISYNAGSVMAVKHTLSKFNASRGKK